MLPPAELSFDEILKFMLAHNGKVTNHELVKHFKVFLMNPDMRDEARSTFKKHVNTLAIIKNQNNEKWLILKKKFIPISSRENEDGVAAKVPDTSSTVSIVESPPDPVLPQPPYRPPPPLQLNQDFNVLTNIIQDSQPSFTESLHNDSKESLSSMSEEIPPKVYPRRKSSSDKSNEKHSSAGQLSHRSSIPNQDGTLEESVTPTLTSSRSESMLVDNEQTISVKERKQMFNRMASENDVLKTNKFGANSSQNVDEEDRASLEHKGESEPLDSRQKQWILNAARGDYHALAKMCKENSKLVRTKGYTPLHIAMQFRHENVYRLLVEVYDADPHIRDWAGRKPNQYLVQMDNSLSPGSYRKKESFLRIGSLNVRVKKTTEAFSNFLGVGATRSSAYLPKTRERDVDRRSDEGDQLHKTWGSADNIQKDDKLMPPPSSKVKRRGASGRRGLSSHSRSTPSTPDQTRAQIGTSGEGDSDSDTAAGFHAAWRHQRASCT